MDAASAIEVRVIEFDIPEDVRPEWAKRTVMRCGCGFARGAHPQCALCGIAIGPTHIERFAARIPVEVYADVFDERRGFWKIGRLVERRWVCRHCNDELMAGRVQLLPIRRPSRERNRLAKVNAWRRRRGLPELEPSTPLDEQAARV